MAIKEDRLLEAQMALMAMRSEEKRKKSLIERGARTLAPKSVEGFGATLGGALATKSKFFKGALKSQADLDDITLKLVKKIVEKRRKGEDTSRLEAQYRRNVGQQFNLESIIPETQKSAKQIVGEGLGVLGTVALGAKPSKSLAKRLAFGTVYGAGAGAKRGLEVEEEAEKIIKKAAIGGLIGFGISGSLELAGYGLKKLAKGRWMSRRTGNIYNKELQPKTSELAGQIKREAQTTGQRVRDVVDAKGNPVYVGKYSTLLDKSKNEIKKHGQLLSDKIKVYDDITINRSEATRGMFAKLGDEYGHLEPSQLKTVNKLVKKMPTEMNMSGALKNKRMYDGLISDTSWSKIVADKVDPQVAFATEVKYLLRDNLRKLINEKTGDAAIQQLNYRMSTGMQVRDLVSQQLAIRAKQKISGSGGIFWKMYGRVIDDVIFNPAITTRWAQFQTRLGEKVGQTIPRQAARIGAITEGIEELE